MRIKQFDLWLAVLNPRRGTEAGKARPVLIIQTDLLNKTHPSTIICPITTKLQKKAKILRVHMTPGTAKVKEASDITIDQIRAIDNSRLLRKIGNLGKEEADKVKQNLRIILDLEF